ncbi:MAG: hypothetical protein N0A00_03675 [Candidatus Bathyarchaeota archaeon]|nr:hypothetical protein [Candidatus Bathyarchaeota archaeon]
MEYDHQKGLSKVIIEGNVNVFLQKFDELFGTPKLKPSSHIAITDWCYVAEKDSISLYMGGKKFPWSKMNIGRNIRNVIRRQCYLFGKGWKYISVRDEAAGQRPVKGHLKLGFDNSMVSLLHKVIRFSSIERTVMKERYTLMLLVGAPPRTVDDAFTVSKAFYKVDNKEKTKISLNEDVIKYIHPHEALGLLMEAPDLLYHNFILGLVKSYVQGQIDISRLPLVSIYVFAGGRFDESKSFLVHFTCSNNYLQGVYSTLRGVHGVKRTSDMINHINKAIQYLGAIVQRAQVKEELTAIEAAIPHIRAFISNLLTGTPYAESLYMAVRILKELERRDESCKFLAGELLRSVCEKGPASSGEVD